MRVTIGCDFPLLTPFLDLIISNPVDVTASSAFPISSGMLSLATLVPVIPTLTPTPAPTRDAGADARTPATRRPRRRARPRRADGHVVPTPTPRSPCATCPNFVQGNQSTSGAQATWIGAGFTTTVIFSPLVPPHYNMKDQSIASGSSRPCATTSITVYATKQ